MNNKERTIYTNFHLKHGKEAEKPECPDSPNGQHRFVDCDEWEPTCIYCGKFQ